MLFILKRWIFFKAQVYIVNYLEQMMDGTCINALYPNDEMPVTLLYV